MISKLAYKAHTRGFTFIEVLVALVIIAVGVAGLVSLQRTFMQSSVRATERSAALELAQHRLEELRFTLYEDIASGSDTVVRDDNSYALSWNVTPQYYNGQWRTTGDANLPDPLPPEPDAKAVVIDVAWQQRGGEAQTLSLEGWLGRLTMRDGGLSVTAPPPRNEPRVVYNPGAAPEVIAVKLTEDDSAVAYQVKETTRPTPTVQRNGDKLTVRFDTVTYDEATQTQRVEDFITVNCSCELTGFEEGGLTPQRLTLVDGRLALDPDGGKPARKITGRPNPAVSNQSELCTQCCRDHHDNSAMVTAGRVYKHDTQRNQDGNHRHFRMENGTLTQVTGNGGIYDESCRMRRIDGWYAMYPDWQFYALTATSADYLIDPNGAATYTDYVRDVVKSLVMGESLPNELTDRDMNVYPGGYQLIGRGIYLDDMSAEHESVVRNAIINNEPDWISKVPFYEVNLTLLGEWQASNSPVASVTNEAIQTIVDPEQNYYGTYSRGRVSATMSGVSTMTVSANMGNASVLGSQPIHSNEQGTLTSSLAVAVDGDIGLLPAYSITGNIYCLQFDGAACKNFHYKDVSVSGLGVDCTFSKQGNADTGSFACNGIPAGTTTTISFYKDGFSFSPSSKSFVLLGQNETFNVVMQEN